MGRGGPARSSVGAVTLLVTIVYPHDLLGSILRRVETMVEHACLINGRPTDHISHRDRGLSYGDGVFETLAVIDGRIVDLDAHLARLYKGLERLSITAPNEQMLRDEMSSLAVGQYRA